MYTIVNAKSSVQLFALIGGDPRHQSIAIRIRKDPPPPTLYLNAQEAWHADERLDIFQDPPTENPTELGRVLTLQYLPPSQV
jgi:hypothetical protein